jgi:hypothetical protein
VENKIFFDENYSESAESQNPVPRGLIGRLVAWGIAKDERAARYILIGATVLGIFLAGALYIQNSSPGNSFGNYNAMKVAHPELFQDHPQPVR